MQGPRWSFWRWLGFGRRPLAFELDLPDVNWSVHSIHVCPSFGDRLRFLVCREAVARVRVYDLEPPHAAGSTFELYPPWGDA